jgi:Ca2+-binding RTX toxin-like protein
MGATVGAATAQGAILNDDAIPAPSLSISSAPVSHSEGALGSTAFAFTVTRTGDLSAPSSAAWSVAGSGAHPADAADFVGGVLPSGTVAFAAGESITTVTVNVAGDSVVEPDEGFTVALASPMGATLATSTATGTILNDDSLPSSGGSGGEGGGAPSSGGGGSSGTGGVATGGSPGLPVVGATFDGGGSDDVLAAGRGVDSIRGLDGNDTITGGVGADLVNGNKGADLIHGGAGTDTLYGGQGGDTVFGDTGQKLINGNMGDDVIIGGTGASTLYGGQDNDTIHGGQAADGISGDLGNDILFGGAGADRFSFAPNGGQDWIGDFNGAEGDRIVLPAGTAYTVTSYQGQVVIALATGDHLGLAGVGAASFSPDWIAFA